MNEIMFKLSTFKYLTIFVNKINYNMAKYISETEKMSVLLS